MKRKYILFLICSFFFGGVSAQTLEQTAREADVTKTALIVVGEVLDGTYERSKLYDPTFTTEFRQASCSKKELGQTGENQSTEMRQEAEGQSK